MENFIDYKIKWNLGDGYIYIKQINTSESNLQITSDFNDIIDRSLLVNIFSNSNNKSLKVTQIGLREIFEGFLLLDGDLYVLKNELQK